MSTAARSSRFVRSLFVVSAALGLAAIAGCSAAADGDAASNDESADALSTTSYNPATAVAYAAAHWNDGRGECAQFVSDAVRAAHLSMPEILWVPTLVSTLANVPHEEHVGAGSASASAGDIVVFSNAAGASFCGPGHNEGVACGHTCLVTSGGSSTSSIKVDCHNRAHHGSPVSYFLSEYAHYRVYHMSAGGSVAREVSKNPAPETSAPSGDDDDDDDSSASTTTSTSTSTTSGGCWSATLGKTVGEDACVTSAHDGVEEQCVGASWYSGVSKGVGPDGACTSEQ